MKYTLFTANSEEALERPVENGAAEIIENLEIAENGAEGEGDKKKKRRNRKKGNKGVCQTDPPTIPIVELFPDQVFPEGEIMDYPQPKDDRTAKDRFTSEEKRALDRMHKDIYNEVRLAAEAHRQVNIKSRIFGIS